MLDEFFAPVADVLDRELNDELRSRLPGVLFAEWALGVLGAYTPPLKLANTDGEPYSKARSAPVVARRPRRPTWREAARPRRS